MPFEPSPKVQALQKRLLAFIDEHIYPNEQRHCDGRSDEHGVEVIDWAIQAHGGGGTGNDFVFARAYAMSRTPRLADGPDEVHRHQIGKLELRKYQSVDPTVDRGLAA